MILIINNHSLHLDSLKKVVKKLGHEILLKDQRSFLDDFKSSSIKGIILSGGGPDLDEKIDLDNIIADIAALLNFDVPVLGICEGHQILGTIFGGRIEKLIEKREGINKIKKLKDSVILAGIPKKFDAYEAHWRYIKKIPKSFDLVASSKKNKVEAISHKTKPIYGVQFHPEVSGEVGEKIL